MRAKIIAFLVNLIINITADRASIRQLDDDVRIVHDHKSTQSQILIEGEWQPVTTKYGPQSMLHFKGADADTVRDEHRAVTYRRIYNNRPTNGHAE